MKTKLIVFLVGSVLYYTQLAHGASTFEDAEEEISPTNNYLDLIEKELRSSHLTRLMEMKDQRRCTLKLCCPIFLQCCPGFRCCSSKTDIAMVPCMFY